MKKRLLPYVSLLKVRRLLADGYPLLDTPIASQIAGKPGLIN